MRHRRRYRRNPGIGSGIVGTIKQGAIDGALVTLGRAAGGRVADLIGKVSPIGGVPGVILADVGAAVAVSIAAKKVSPAHARMIAAGAFSVAIQRVVAAVSPGAAAMLGDGGIMPGYAAYPDAYGAYPAQIGDGGDNYGAYPVGVGDMQEA